MATPLKPTLETTPPSVQPSSIERVEAWTVTQAADALAATSISSPTPSRLPRGSSVKLDIPLDLSALDVDRPGPAKPDNVHTVYKRHEPIRRDSLKRREALLKGKEGSRQRRRWENDRLLGNPHAQPPLPEDWEVRPATYPRQSVPYFLAPLWDAQYARAKQQREQRNAAAKAPVTKEDAAAAKVKRELKEKLKRSRGARGLLQDLEEEVRAFVEQWEEKRRELEREGLVEPDSSEDEEIVFVGRNGAMSDDARRNRRLETLEKDKIVFESLLHDHGASFGYAVPCCPSLLASVADVALQPLPCPRHRAVLRSGDVVCHDARCASQAAGVCGSEDGSGDQTAECHTRGDAQAALDCRMTCYNRTSSCILDIDFRHIRAESVHIRQHKSTVSVPSLFFTYSLSPEGLRHSRLWSLSH